MMTLSDVELLRSAELRQAIEDNIECDPTAVALDRRIPHARLVATQVKYLQRARRKLPRLYEARCIIPPLAFEQSSSEDSAQRKGIAGDSLLDLTCGLGIDTMAFATRFRRVVALERDAVLAEVVRYNMSLLGIDNVEVVNTSAEEYVAVTTDHFDWVFADPDRRSAEGRKMVCLEDCSPNVAALMPRLKHIAHRIGLKLSPLFDVVEAFRLCSPAEVEVVSTAGECKELNIYTGAQDDLLRIAITGLGEWCFTPEDMLIEPSTEAFDATAWRYMLVPDVALQKARVAISALRPHASIWSNNGYAFATELPTEQLPARIFEIESIEPYRPKELKRILKGLGVEIMKRDTQLSVDAVRRAIGTKAGSDKLLAITTIAGGTWIINLKI
jgi:hypothetical protein